MHVGASTHGHLWAADNRYLEKVGRASFYGLLAQWCPRLFRLENFAGLYSKDNGYYRVPWAPHMALPYARQTHGSGLLPPFQPGNTLVSLIPEGYLVRADEPAMQGPVEVDETYLVDLENREHSSKKLWSGRGGAGKTIAADAGTGLREGCRTP